VAAPEAGEDFQLIADDYQKFIVPGTFICVIPRRTLWTKLVRIGLTHWQHPSFFAYFPTGCTFEGMLADLYATSTPNPGFNVRLIIEHLRHESK